MSLNDSLVYWTLSGVVWLINRLPLRVRIAIFYALVRAILLFLPRYRRLAHKNLEMAFPERDYTWRSTVILQMYRTLASLIVDIARIPALNDRWVGAHVEFPNLKGYQEAHARKPELGILLASAHLGSFEMLAHGHNHYTGPLAFIVRNFKSAGVDAWWNDRRARSGNVVIPRSGAYKGMLKAIKAGTSVGILLDQNVTRNYAVFVDFFGRKAATSKALALAAIRTGAPVGVSTVTNLGLDRYRMNFVDCRAHEIVDDPTLTEDEKILQLTQRVTSEIQKMIEADPGGWFWLHRRWKTTPEGVPEDFYGSRKVV